MTVEYDVFSGNFELETHGEFSSVGAVPVRLLNDDARELDAVRFGIELIEEPFDPVIHRVAGGEVPVTDLQGHHRCPPILGTRRRSAP
jgi:hypothetical protein